MLGSVGATHKRFDSEGFLAKATKAANLTLRSHLPWMFCKLGDSRRSWGQCTHRVRAALRCDWLDCAWCGAGCKCINRTCEPSTTQSLPGKGFQLCYKLHSAKRHISLTPAGGLAGHHFRLSLPSLAKMAAPRLT